MNSELIKRLIAQATVEDMDLTWGRSSELKPELLVELVVRECLTFVEPYPDSGDIDDVVLAATHKEIMNHFGIKQ